eukprot:XP_763754.1 hypothetical protein [Theileria parva strain Muguga]
MKDVDNIRGNVNVLIDHFNPVQSNSVPQSHGNAEAGPSSVTQSERVEAELYSNEIGIRVRLTGEEKDMRVLSRTTNILYIVYILKSLLELLLYNNQFKNITTQSDYNKLSIMTVSLMTFQEVFEIFLLLFHSNIFFSSLIYFTLLLFLNTVLLFSFGDRRIRIKSDKDGIYYFTFMTILLIIWYYYYNNKSVVVCVVYLIWVPQIMLDVWNGQNNPLNHLFILLIIVLKLLLPVYIFYFKDNIFNFDLFDGDTINTSTTLTYILLLLSLLQIVVILVQRLYGARYLFNWPILPKIYSYVRPWTKIMQDDLQQCNICMFHILYHNKSGWLLSWNAPTAEDHYLPLYSSVSTVIFS